MAISQRTCGSHPERVAIGVCIITGRAICAECSTRYEGVNYSREGLRILQERRAAAHGQHAARSGGWRIAAMATAPIFLYLLYLAYLVSLEFLVNVDRFPME